MLPRHPFRWQTTPSPVRSSGNTQETWMPISSQPGRLIFSWQRLPERGLITADAQALYETGVQLAFEYWQTEMPANYLTDGAAAYGIDGADKVGQIITQKWIANIINGYEGWIEFRRTGFPQLKTIAASLNDNLIPVRMPYPTDEAALNTANYETATAENGNSINARVWWDLE